MLRYCFFVLISFLSLGISTAYAQEGVQFLALDWLGVAVGDIANFFNRLYTVSLWVGAFIAVVVIAYAGIEYMLSEAVPGKLDGKKRIQDAILGLLMLLSIYIFFNTINPNILNLEITLPEAEVSGSGLNSGSQNSNQNTQPQSLNIIETTPEMIRISCADERDPSCFAAREHCRSQGYVYILPTPEGLICRRNF